MGWLVRFWFRTILRREPNVLTRHDTWMMEEYYEQRIAQARHYDAPPETYAHFQAALDQIRSYRQEGLIP